MDGVYSSAFQATKSLSTQAFETHPFSTSRILLKNCMGNVDRSNAVNATQFDVVAKERHVS